MPRAVVLLVASRALVLLDDVPIVLVEREAAGHSRLFVGVHAQPIEIQNGHVVHDQRRIGTQRVEICACLVVHLARVRIGIRREIDLGPRDVEETERIAGR